MKYTKIKENSDATSSYICEVKDGWKVSDLINDIIVDMSIRFGRISVIDKDGEPHHIHFDKRSDHLELKFSNILDPDVTKTMDIEIDKITADGGYGYMMFVVNEKRD